MTGELAVPEGGDILSDRIGLLPKRRSKGRKNPFIDPVREVRVRTEAGKSGPAKGKVAGLAEMLPEYYGLRGWTADGVPTDETLARLAL